MAVFDVTVRRTITYEGVFEIEAEDREDAHDIATDMLSTLPNDNDRWESVSEHDAITGIEGEEDEDDEDEEAAEEAAQQ